MGKLRKTSDGWLRNKVPTKRPSLAYDIFEKTEARDSARRRARALGVLGWAKSVYGGTCERPYPEVRARGWPLKRDEGRRGEASHSRCY